MLSTQIQVSKDTGEVEALYLWDNDFPWQGGFTKNEDGWTAWVERTDETDAADISFNDAVTGETFKFFPTLYAAIQAYLASEYAAPSAKHAAQGPYGIVLG